MASVYIQLKNASGLDSHRKRRRSLTLLSFFLHPPPPWLLKHLNSRGTKSWKKVIRVSVDLDFPLVNFSENLRSLR
jgi:hypothetical protein